ncbi:MAG: single-stranded-DNA-specific exonuclease RecJ [Eubacteriales bacterium]|nr:single-stranded-DNA-specific exonuclease RecJ [Eubacteriales bacterium]
MRKSDEIVKEILINRGITSPEEREEFLSDNPKKTYDPFLLDGMQEGVDLLLSEIDGGGKICIYGDYDADGVTSVCIMSHGIAQLTDSWFYYIPSRFEEGYGLNRNALDKIKYQGASTVVTVDCGCVSYDEVEYAKSIGLKVIVTDHHTIEDIIADCIVIDPQKPEKFLNGNNPYPFRDLAGCGVAFKFVQALQRKKGFPKSVLNDCLDMVAIGTVGDIVSLQDENRTLVKYGIAIANSQRRKALSSLAKAISLENITSENIAFGIVPHINATGRMDSAGEAVDLFISDDENIIEEKIEKLISCNKERKLIQENAYEKCLNQVRGEEDFLVLYMPDMHEGIAGIVAGKLKDKFYRPVIIVTPGGDGFLKGTGRSIPSIDIYKVLSRNSNLFVRFGGHRSACGFLMPTDNLQKLHEGIKKETEILKEKDEALFKKTIKTDINLIPGEINVELAREIAKIAPFGEGNPNPRCFFEEVFISRLSYMGENKTHARFSICEEADNGKRSFVDCVLFRRAQEMSETLERGDRVSIIGTISYQVWRGQERVQIVVEEII